MRQMDETKSVTNSEEVEYQVCHLVQSVIYS